MTDKKCPKCGSRNFQINDYFTRAYIYEVKDGIVEAEGMGEESEHVRTICECRNCKHQWPRNGLIILLISNLNSKETMTQIEQVKAEIERLKAEIPYHENAWSVLDKLKVFINSFPAKQPIEDLEEEINDYFEKHIDNTLKCGGEEFTSYDLLITDNEMLMLIDWYLNKMADSGESGISFDSHTRNGMRILMQFKKEDEQ